MKAKTLISIAVGALCLGTLFFSEPYLCAQDRRGRIVRIAELEIDPAQLDAYKAALREEIEASIRVEPGVLTLYAVSLKDQSNQIRLFETYASTAAYQAHLQSEHFKKYKSETAHMVKSLRLIETEPVLLGAK
jgi:quinol monooxygenase YgiN